MSKPDKAIFLRPNGLQAGKTTEQFRRYMDRWAELGFPVSRIELVTPEILDLQKQLVSAKDSLAILARAIEFADSRMDSRTVKSAIAAVKSRGDWPLEEKEIPPPSAP